MTFVVELRELKKSLPQPVVRFWQRAAHELCALRTRLAFLGLLGVVLEYPVERGVTSNDGVLALLCGVLTAAVSATLGLLHDTGSLFSALFSDHASPVLLLGHRLSLCFEEPLLPFEVCPETGPFPAFSGNCLFGLVASALLLFGCGFKRQEPAKLGNGR